MDRRGSNVGIAAAPERDDVAIAVARSAFSAWLRSARELRGLRLDDVARVTRIQLRTLERLEQAAFNELPADVFVRGFIRNYARVVGLDPDDAIARYDGCGVSPGPVAAAKAKAFVDVFESGPTKPAGVESVVRRGPEEAPLGRRVPQATPSAPIAIPVAAIAEIAAEPAPVVEPAPAEVAPAEVAPAIVEAAPAIAEDPKPKRKRGKRGGKGRSKKKIAPTPGVEAVEAREAPAIAVEDLECEIIVVEEIVRPPVRVTAPSVAAVAPSLVIDDDDPDSAEREREERAAKDRPRSFLPQALLDNDRGSRQGGLTLAVIILLIVATLTLSYLMRRPSAGGEGITSIARDAATDRA